MGGVDLDGLRSSTLGHEPLLVLTDRDHVLGTLAWLAGLLLVFVPLSVRAFRRA